MLADKDVGIWETDVGGCCCGTRAAGASKQHAARLGTTEKPHMGLQVWLSPRAPALHAKVLVSFPALGPCRDPAGLFDPFVTQRRRLMATLGNAQDPAGGQGDDVFV